MGLRILTKHVTALVLAATLLGNIGLHTEVSKGEVGDRVFGWVEAANHGESSSIVHVATDLLELRAQGWKWEVGRADKVAILVEH